MSSSSNSCRCAGRKKSGTAATGAAWGHKTGEKMSLAITDAYLARGRWLVWRDVSNNQGNENGAEAWTERAYGQSDQIGQFRNGLGDHFCYKK